MHFKSRCSHHRRKLNKWINNTWQQADQPFGTKVKMEDADSDKGFVKAQLLQGEVEGSGKRTSHREASASEQDESPCVVKSWKRHRHVQSWGSTGTAGNQTSDTPGSMWMRTVPPAGDRLQAKDRNIQTTRKSTPERCLSLQKGRSLGLAPGSSLASLSEAERQRAGLYRPRCSLPCPATTLPERCWDTERERWTGPEPRNRWGTHTAPLCRRATTIPRFLLPSLLLPAALPAPACREESPAPPAPLRASCRLPGKLRAAGSPIFFGSMRGVRRGVGVSASGWSDGGRAARADWGLCCLREWRPCARPQSPPHGVPATCPPFHHALWVLPRSPMEILCRAPRERPQPVGQWQPNHMKPKPNHCLPSVISLHPVDF